MSKALYAGIEGIARKVKKMYVGVNGIARKVKKGYIGINGIARLFFAGGAPVYGGETTPLPNANSWTAGAGIGNKAILISTSTHSSELAKAVVYDSDLAQTQAPDCKNQTVWPYATAAIGETALFGSLMGWGGLATNYTWQVDGYSKDLTKVSVPDVKEARAQGAATVVGPYAVFGGGVIGYDRNTPNYADAYDAELTRSNAAEQNVWGQYIAAAHAGEYGFFGTPKSVGVIDKELTMHGYVSGGSGEQYCAAASTEKYAVFTGGGDYPCYKGAAAFDGDMTYTAASDYPEVVYQHNGTTFSGYAIFAGGQRPSPCVYYDDDLTIFQLEGLGRESRRCGVAATDEICVFGGGENAGSNKVVGYTLE